MLTIGHSFGGLIVYAAVAQYLTDQAAALEVKSLIAGPGPNNGYIAEQEKQIPGYGDLVVVLNPAIEATRYEPIREIRDTAPQRGFAPWQSPVFIEVTSVGDSIGSGDRATGTVFPIGRFFSTLGQDIGGSFRSGEYTEAVTAFGHYPVFWTHFLTNTNPAATNAETLSPIHSDEECRSLREFNRAFRPNGYLVKGWTRTYSSGAQLRALEQSKSDPNNPYWIIRADPSIILDQPTSPKGCSSTSFDRCTTTSSL